MAPGKFITIEGGEGVGKSTQISVVRATLETAGFEVTLTREPGGTLRAERIRELLLTPTTETMPQSAELLLMFAARALHIENIIRPALARGAWVICDRFTDATYAYQGGGRGMPIERIAQLEQWVQGDLRPHLTVLLDAPVAVALARAKERNRAAGNEAGDRFEQEHTPFFERVRAAYLERARQDPDRVRVIDAARDRAAVESDVIALISQFMSRNR